VLYATVFVIRHFVEASVLGSLGAQNLKQAMKTDQELPPRSGWRLQQCEGPLRRQLPSGLAARKRTPTIPFRRPAILTGRGANATTEGSSDRIAASGPTTAIIAVAPVSFPFA
jgi:hypothetical protein